MSLLILKKAYLKKNTFQILYMKVMKSSDIFPPYVLTLYFKIEFILFNSEILNSIVLCVEQMDIQVVFTANLLGFCNHWVSD